jgi:hypothetical protein
MQQRVSICRALIHNPSVLLMDEPFAALDAMTREELGFELMRIWDTDKKTVVFVTHNISEAIRLADRVVAMSPRPGRVAKVLEIELPRPRTLDMEFTPQFKCYSENPRSDLSRGGANSHDDGCDCGRPARRMKHWAGFLSVKAIAGSTLTFIAMVVLGSGAAAEDPRLAVALAQRDCAKR